MGLFGNSAALDKLDRDMTAIANGDADLSHSIGSPNGNIEGRISANINRFFGRVRDLITHARQGSVSIATDAARMNHLVLLTDSAVRRQEELASDVFQSSNQAACIPTPLTTTPHPLL